MGFVKKVLLIKPSSYPGSKIREESTHFRAWPPLSLLNCAAFLKDNGFQVKLLDLDASPTSDKAVLRIVRKFDVVFITSTSLDRWQCPNLDFADFLQFVRKLSEVNKNIYALGFHGTVNPEMVLRETGVRAVIRGEPEMAVVDLCKTNNLQKISGISFISNKNQRIVYNKDRPLLDMKVLPVPAYSLLDLNSYQYVLMGDRFVLLETSRGCPFHCKFCVKDVMYGSGVRFKSFDQIVKEISYVIKKLKAKNIYFFDLEFSNNLKLVEQIADFIIKKKYPINWCCQMRMEKLTPKLLKKMKDSGCSLIHIGVESGADRILTKTRKGVTKEKILRGLGLISQAGIRTLCFFILGFPFEKKKEIFETIRFAKKLNPNYVSFHLYNPYPGSQKDFSGFKDNGNLIGSFHPKYSGKMLSLWSKYAIASFYLRPKKMLELLTYDNKSLRQGIKIFVNQMQK